MNNPLTVGEKVTGGYPIRSSAIVVNAVTQGARDYYSTLTVVTQRDPHPLHGGGITEKQACEYAHLFAAAPKMLDTLEKLEVQFAMGLYLTDPAMQKVMHASTLAAIKAAKHE